MNVVRFSLSALLVPLLLLTLAINAKALERMAIAANGGSGPLANTLPAITLAGIMDVDFIELKLVATKDNILIVHNDLMLDPATDVATIFPDRARQDGRFYAIDFTLSEIRQLRRIPDPTLSQSVPACTIPTFEEALSLLKYIEREMYKKSGVAAHILQPQFHRNEGKDISSYVLQSLSQYGYEPPPDRFILLCLDGDELQRIHRDLLPGMGMKVALMQLIDTPASTILSNTSLPAPYDYRWMLTRLGLRVVSSYADSIALHTRYFTDGVEPSLPDTYIKDAKTLGLKTYAFTLQDNPQTFPAHSRSYADMLDHFYSQRGLDGIITASPMATTLYRQMKREQLQSQQNQESAPDNPAPASTTVEQPPSQKTEPTPPPAQ
jgi:glycerophosphoryl diester phosphodiesterase